MRPGTRIRLATGLDRSALDKLDLRIATDTYRRELITAAIPLGRCWIAELGENAVGYAFAARHFFGRDFLDLLLVAESARRGGIGFALISAVEEACAGDCLFTSTNESNVQMRALLAKRGYVPSGRIENLDPGDPELVFVKFLRR